MKRTPITLEIGTFPTPFRPLLQGAPLYDSSCSREARVILIDRDAGYYLKSAPVGSLLTEAEMTRFFHGKGLGAEVLRYLPDEDGHDWLLTTRVPGEDCTHAQYLEEPERLCKLMGELLRGLHETDFTGCPVPDRMSAYLATVDRNYHSGIFHPSYLPEHLRGMTADDAKRLVDENRSRLRTDALLHGDYCLPNIMLNGWRFSGFIDLDGGGVGDRHIDLFWGAWSLTYNLKSPTYGARFLDAYGRDSVQSELLDVIAAAETFG
ncbi:MAG: aminoglycoside 3'-phosphotransferase [Clostridia bacterium]|nr:aminoglycoside 3'-phosphotransferase [Clostridia bacterium]